MNTSKKRILLASLALILLLSYLVFSGIVKRIWYFVISRNDFKVIYNNGTEVINDFFNISFYIKRNCQINSEYIIKDDIFWAGNLICENATPISVSVFPYESWAIQNIKQYKMGSRIYGGEMNNDNFMLKITDNNYKKILIIGGRGNRDIWSDILETIKENKL
ncbi:MAG: hypothetical protein WC715_06280 [Patescibacteria group bacterium]|jgi:hypothetical protein